MTDPHRRRLVHAKLSSVPDRLHETTIEPLSLDADLELFEKIANGEITAIRTPFPSLNEALDGGLWPEVSVLVGNPGGGKSQLAFQLIEYAAKVEKVPCLYVPLELPRQQVSARILSVAAGLPWSALYRGKDRKVVHDARRVLGQCRALPIRLAKLPPGGWKANRFMSVAQEMLRTFPEAPKILIVVDYLQRIRGERDSEALRFTIGEAMYNAVEVTNAKSMGWKVAIVFVSATPKSNYPMLDAGERKTKADADLPEIGVADARAWMGVGKESGDIEYAAPTVMTLCKNGEGETTLAIAKNRTGKTCWVPLDFDGTSFK